jgi:hypothetical protein
MDVSDAFSSPSLLEASASGLSGPPCNVGPDFTIEESPLPQPVTLRAHRGRGRPRRQASDTPQEVAVMEPKRKLRTRKNAEAAFEDPWANFSNAPILTPSSPKKPRRARAPRPVNWTPILLHTLR